jgi:putative ABC transport system permease protein
MNLPTLSIRNTMRNKTRTVLTVLGVTVAVVAFGFLRTVIGAWYIGIEQSSNDRLITRNATSIVQTLPISYGAKIEKVPGVSVVSYGNWFSGIYKEPKNFFAKFAVDAPTFFQLYPEFLLKDEEKAAFLAEKTGCIVGEKLAKQYGFKVGDTMPIMGDIYPGDWKFKVSAIFTGKEKVTDTSSMYFHWKYLEETVEPAQRGHAGFYYVGIKNPDQGPAVSKAVDDMFKGSAHETLTESEKAFQLSFISMSAAIINALRLVSWVVLLIVALILGNTIAMSVRDRSAEVAVLKVLGFRGGRLALLITAESVFLGILGGLMGILVSTPLINGFGKFVEENMGNWFPVFHLAPETMVMMVGLSAAVGLLAALIPSFNVARLGVANAFRRLG